MTAISEDSAPGPSARARASLGTSDRVDAGASRRLARAKRRRKLAFLGVVPFLAYLAVFLGVPTITVAWQALHSDSGQLTLKNIDTALHGIWLEGFIKSLQLSAISAGIAAAVGMLATVALASSRNEFLRRVSTTGAGVFANAGGVPLAFSFVATLGAAGIITSMLTDVGFNLTASGFRLDTISGVVIVYLYFLIPVMVLVMLPPVEALKREWFEAAANLGARRWQYWRHVGGPVLWPPFLAAFLLLFADAFAAYATAEALTDGQIPISPIQLGSLLNGNVVAGETHLGDAIGLGMIVVIVVAGAGYVLLQRKGARWLR
jgi:putative spermidine/putrescine transport system permease protein